MPPKNDILKDFYIGWTTPKGEVIGKVKSSTVSHDGITYTVELDNLKKEKKMKCDLENVTSISIERDTFDGSVVTATAYGRDPYCPGHVAVIKRASAKCGPNDIFDFNIGAKLAMDRLYEGYDMTPKQKRKPYNGKIFIRCGNECATLNNNTIYYVQNGMIMSKKSEYPVAGFREPYIFEDMSDDELSKAIDNNVFYGGTLY